MNKEYEEFLQLAFTNSTEEGFELYLNGICPDCGFDHNNKSNDNQCLCFSEIYPNA